MIQDLKFSNETVRAYSDLYLETSTRILGDAFDFVANTLDITLNDFVKMLSMSNIGSEFERGNPTYVAGCNGCELARKIIKDCKNEYIDTPDAMYLDKSPEYWAGYVIAVFQWYSNESFSNIFKAIPINDVLKMYETYHEMDLAKTINAFRKKMNSHNTMTRLAIYRKNLNMTQKELAEESGVPLRQIQLFEQRERKINLAKTITVYQLSKALNCNVDDIIERDYT